MTLIIGPNDPIDDGNGLTEAEGEDDDDGDEAPHRLVHKSQLKTQHERSQIIYTIRSQPSDFADADAMRAGAATLFKKYPTFWNKFVAAKEIRRRSWPGQITLMCCPYFVSSPNHSCSFGVKLGWDNFMSCWFQF